MIKKLMIGAAALCMAATPAMAQDGQDRSIRVENHSGIGAYVTSITITNEHGRSYALLAGRVISPGYNRTLNFNDGEGHGHCVFRATARFNNGTYAQRVIDVCEKSVWQLYDVDNTVL